MSSPDDGLYASLVAFETFVGQDFLLGFRGGQESEETAPRLRSLLLTATARINSALARGGYRVPVVDSDVTDSGLVEQAKKLLETHCCIFTAQYLAVGASDLPPALKSMLDASKAWEDGIAARRIDLLGVIRPTADLTAGSNFVFISNGCGPDFPPGFHSRRSTFPV